MNGSNASTSGANDSSVAAAAASSGSSASQTGTVLRVDHESEQAQLTYSWVFWVLQRDPQTKFEKNNYSTAIRKLATFSTCEQFWGVYSRMKRPHELNVVSDYFLFKEGLRPTWEDQPEGGKWIVRLKKGLASRYWENLVIALISEQFDVGTEICGAVISLRHSEDILSVWNQTADAGRLNLKIRDTMKRVLGLPQSCVMEYKAHSQALTDQSSFRNTSLYL